MSGSKPTSSRPSGLAQARGGLSLLRQSFGFVTGRVHEFHRAISDIPFKVTGHTPAAIGSKPVEAVHNAVTDGVYRSVQVSGEALLTLGERLLVAAERNGVSVPAVQHPALDDVRSALSGLIGDHMALERNPLVPTMGFYQDDVLITDLSGYTKEVVVFVHGLCCNEHSWQLFRAQHTPYGAQLAAMGYQVLYLRYNTGLPIAKNGERLARLLAQVPAKSLHLVGHSMGGLVIRSACAQQPSPKWVGRVTQVVCLGSPHRGAPLERLAHLGSAVLEAFPLSKPWGEILKLRSTGIRDLHDGIPAESAPPLPKARYRFIGSAISQYFPEFIGDGLVDLPSALAKDLRAEVIEVPDLNHFELLNHARVWAAMKASF